MNKRIIVIAVCILLVAFLTGLLLKIYVPFRHVPFRQVSLYLEFEATDNPGTKTNNAAILAALWKKGLLNNKIKDRLIDKYFQLRLFQYRSESIPTYHFQVRCHQTFPFPDVWISFTPKLSANGKVVWSPDRPQQENALSANNMLIASLSGGSYLTGPRIQTGDVFQYAIKMQEKKHGEIVWEKTILTNKIVVKSPVKD